MSSEQSVPKPMVSLEAVSTADPEVSTIPPAEPIRSGSGIADPVGEACERAQEAGIGIVTDLGPQLDRGHRKKVLTTFRRTLFPPRPPGRRRKEAITAAHRDWKNGMRGVALYRAHIPGWETGALLDRLTHHVHILEMNGESYRLKDSKRRRPAKPRS